jgi:alkanesulfonate monooxygenase SsuD/methylene tetrahydromethanopterin reductase-like flavin-dependent oxidoreductase (luciferase family)
MGIDEAVPHDERYAAAEEYMSLLYKLVPVNHSHSIRGF